ncbi:Nif3-like dinuclear metal center hexameric protein [Pollutibacter soli]|uniref:Nif3-like dinuclear metal center hexameric protein n=1 Tax=Pollutibacter soli TaxID=3034157 RepID=UPI003013C80E
MKTAEIINFLETVAPTALQEDYDNSGLIVGDPGMECKGAMVCLDITDDVLTEALQTGINLVISHHPLVFRGMKRFSEKNPVGRLLIRAIRENLMIYAIHTNLDNTWDGVSFKMAEKLGLEKPSVLDPKKGQLLKLITFVPLNHVDKVRNALFEAGAGEIGNYSECSFASEGNGSFKAGDQTDPFVGEKGRRHLEPESRLEVILPIFRDKAVIQALKASHPYEEVAFDLVPLANVFERAGSGVVGSLPSAMEEKHFLALVQKEFDIPMIRHSALKGEPIQRVALCGGAGSFLIPKALQAGADIFMTGDLKYHDFFEADGRIILADIGHYESEQYTQDLLIDRLKQKFPNFAVLKTGVRTNPVNYFL